MINIGTFLQDRYFIGKQIGAGGMGAVYVAIDQRFESRVAIKETFFNDQSLSEAFEREARLLNTLHHPVLPHVSDFFKENGAYFLVMEFIEGEDLSEMLKPGIPLPLPDVLRWMDQVLDALDFLHSCSPPIIHQDIKPHNLKVTPRGDIILLDFGLAKLETNKAEASGISGYSKIYSPPEQIENRDTGISSDIFSLGATGYHLLTGRPPIDAQTRTAAIAGGNPDPLMPAFSYNSHITSALNHILQTALALNPGERYASAPAMRTALTHSLDEDFKEIPEIKVNLSTQFPTDETPLKTDIVRKPARIPHNESEISEFNTPEEKEIADFKDRTMIFTNEEKSSAENGDSENYVPFSAPNSNHKTISFGKMILIGVFFLFVFAGVLIAWNFANLENPTNEQVSSPIVQKQSEEVLPESFDQQKGETVSIPETDELKEKTFDIPENKPIITTDKIKTAVSSTETKSIKSADVSKKVETGVSKTLPATKPLPKTVSPKTNKPQNLNTTTLIIVPSAGTSRPRIIPNTKNSKSRQSSASEIDRFFTGKSPRMRNK